MDSYIPNDTKRDWGWANRYQSEIIQVLKRNALHFISIKVAPLANDLEKATDLILVVEGGDVACRIRRADCKHRDLTIRCWRKGNTKTEIHKIKEGFAKWYFYGWVDDKDILRDWIIVDLDKMRTLELFDINRQTIKNKDERTGFYTYSIGELSWKGCLVNCSETLKEYVVKPRDNSKRPA